jgi:hypothetical protein
VKVTGSLARFENTTTDPRAAPPISNSNPAAATTIRGMTRALLELAVRARSLHYAMVLAPD